MATEERNRSRNEREEPRLKLRKRDRETERSCVTTGRRRNPRSPGPGARQFRGVAPDEGAATWGERSKGFGSRAQ